MSKVGKPLHPDPRRDTAALGVVWRPERPLFSPKRSFRITRLDSVRMSAFGHKRTFRSTLTRLSRTAAFGKAVIQITDCFHTECLLDRLATCLKRAKKLEALIAQPDIQIADEACQIDFPVNVVAE